MNIFTKGINLVVVNNKKDRDALADYIIEHKYLRDSLVIMDCTGSAQSGSGRSTEWFNCFVNDVKRSYYFAKPIKIIIVNSSANFLNCDYPGEGFCLCRSIIYITGDTITFKKSRKFECNKIYIIDKDYNIDFVDPISEGLNMTDAKSSTPADRLIDPDPDKRNSSSQEIVDTYLKGLGLKFVTNDTAMPVYSLTTPTRAVYEEHLMESKNVVEYIGDRKKFSFSACTVCLSCGTINNKDDIISVDVPGDIKPYNIKIKSTNRIVCPKCISIKSNSFYCDPYIAQAVLNFNMKEYKTFSSCSGHVINNYSLNLRTDEPFLVTNSYICFKELTDKQKKKIMKAAETIGGIYFFECNNVRNKDNYHNGNNFIVTTSCPIDNYKYMPGTCYELTYDEMFGLLYIQRNGLGVDSEDEGNSIMKNCCRCIELLSESVQKIKKEEYDKVSYKKRRVDTRKEVLKKNLLNTDN